MDDRRPVMICGTFFIWVRFGAGGPVPELFITSDLAVCCLIEDTSLFQAGARCLVCV